VKHIPSQIDIGVYRSILTYYILTKCVFIVFFYEDSIYSFY